MTTYTTIQLRRDTAADWTSDNPVLNQGEAGFETDTGKLKIGDGSTAWTSLAYFAGSGGGAVSSVFGRTGTVTATSGDYTVSEITGAAPLASPALTGTPTAPTQTSGDTSTKIATDAFVATAVAAETSRAETAEALLAPLASCALTGVPTAPTASSGNNTTQVATTAFVATAVSGGGGGAVSSVFGRTGAVVAGSGDYTVSQVTGAAPVSSPTFTGTPAGPTASSGTNTTQLATTAFVHTAVAGGGGGASYITVVTPSGDTTGATDLAAINAALANGGACQLVNSPLTGSNPQTPTTPYYIDGPITPTSGSALIGVQGGWSSPMDAYGADSNISGWPTGTFIKCTSTFVGEAAILMNNASTTALYIGPLLRDFYLDCRSMPTQTGSNQGHGVEVTGSWAGGQMERVTVLYPSGSCFIFQSSSVSGAGWPDNWVIRACKASGARGSSAASVSNQNAGYGFGIWRCPDIVFSDCEASECDSDNWLLNDVTNGMFSNCKGENSGTGNGWHMVGMYAAGYYANFVGCTSNYNQENGFLFDSTAGGSGPADWNMVGCKATNDGQGGTGYAGFAITASPDRIMLTGCFVDGATQSYGVRFNAGTSFGAIISGGSYVKTGSQTFTAISNGGTVTHLPTASTGPGTVNNY